MAPIMIDTIAVPAGLARADFQLAEPMKGRRIVVAMSGGVDSSVVAALAARSGAEVIGVTLQLYDHGAKAKRVGACCAGQDIRDARAVADRLGFAHHVYDHESRFRDTVIDQFADEYLNGRTPIPCVRCYMGVKFTDLFALAKDLGADVVLDGGPNLIEEVKQITGGGSHVVIDFVGELGVENVCWKLLRKGGELIVVGYGGKIEVPTVELVVNEIKIGGSLVGDYTELVELMELNADGKVKMHYSRYALADINTAIDDFKNRRFTGRGVIVP